MKKTFKVKNYKGQLVESLERFTKKYKGMRVVEASEKDGALNIIAEEDNGYEGSGINPDDYISYANAFEAEVRKIVTDPEKAKNILTATDELASRDHVRSMLLDKFLKDDHDGFIQGFGDLFNMSPDEHDEEDVKAAWNELVEAQPRAAIMYQLQGVGPEILDDVLEAAGFETGEPLEEAEDAEGRASQEAAANGPSYTATSYDDNFFKAIKEKAEKRLSIFTQWEPKFQHEISADQRKDIQMKLEMAIALLEKAAPYAEKGQQIKRKVASKIHSIHDKLLSACTDINWLTR